MNIQKKEYPYKVKLGGCQCSTQPANTTRIQHWFLRVRVEP